MEPCLQSERKRTAYVDSNCLLECFVQPAGSQVQTAVGLYAFLIRNIRYWNASLNLLVRRSKPLVGSTHLKTPTS